jgi:Beta propeller domain
MNAIENLPMRNLRPGRPVCARGVRVGALLASGALVISGCTARPLASVLHTGVPRVADVALVRFTSCGDALRNLRAAAGSTVGRGGSAVSTGAADGSGSTASAASPGSASAAPGASVPAGAPAAAGQAAAGQAGSGQAGAGQTSGAAAPGSYSGTNTAQAGVDEPDLVKTDGRRIVTVIGGVLRVIDAQTRQLTGVLDLSAGAGLDGAVPANLLLAGDHALVLFDQGYSVAGAPVPGLPPEMTPPAAGGAGPAGSGLAGSAPAAVPSAGAGPGAAEPGPAVSGPAIPVPIIGPRLVLIDLSAGTPRIISEYTMDGALVDARQVGSVARVVVHSAPRVFFPPYFAQSAQDSTAANRAVIAHATLNAWLPRYALITGNVRRTGQVDCAAASHPAAATYSGTSMLTLLTFDLSSGTLGDGQPVTVVADGDTVYANGSSLYIASDRQSSMPPAGALPPVGAVPGSAPGTAQDPVSATAPATAAAAPPATAAAASPGLPQQYTGLYKFDISGPGRPVYEASGTVPGWLLGSSGTAQYALSEWNGALRVATTADGAFVGWSGQPPQSAVYVLEQVGDQLVTIGKVGGLGQGEQIYAVRFAGPVGYVVTFRQTDPLFTLDLSDPAQPRVAGELLLSGYSAYLDPIDATHVIGVGQDANAQGQTRGTHISLFDVSDLAAPVLLAVYHLQFGHSEAEFDPHAFLYWPASRLLVIPVQLPPAAMPGSGPAAQDGNAPLWPVSEAVVLRVGDHALTELGTITHPAVPGFPAGGQIRRSLVIGGMLWTLSDTGLKASELTTLAPLGWVPFQRES